MKSRLLSILVAISVFASFRLPNQLVRAEPQALPPNLSFQANIYGSAGIETIEYLSDLKFYSWGSFGTNAHVYRARLQSSGEEIAYAISANTPNAFSLNVIPQAGTPLTLTVTSSAYQQGLVEAVSPNELHFTWDINQSGLHIKLHRYAKLIPDERVTVRNVIQERFAVENLGPTIRVMSFTEYLHMDDRARVRDYNNDGRDETLLAINSFTTNGYPVFGKVYLRQEEIDADLVSDGIYATVTHSPYYQLSTDSQVDIALAAYVSSAVQNDVDAEMEVAKDAAILLGLDSAPDQWLVRTYNTDDAGAVFLNGLMVAGSRYSSYPDSNWSFINKYWRQEEDNFVAFASYDLGVCCNSTWGFSLRRNTTTLWNQQSSGSTSQGIAYRHTLRVSQSGEVSDFVQPPPSPVISDTWYIQVRANGGMSFALVDNYPVVGSINDQSQWIEITNLLGQFDNHIHFNAWNDGSSTFDWYYAIRKGAQVVWENQAQVLNSSRGVAHHIELVIDKDGNVYPKLDFPVDYQDRARGTIRNFNSVFNIRTTSMFDHRYPTYGTGDDIFVPYTGDERPDPENVPCRFGYNCYDGHSGYDIDDICPRQASCINPLLVYPAADGIIVQTETGWINNALGCQITIDHGNHWKTVYAHLLDPEEDHDCEGILRKSGAVTRFDRIGLIGCSGTGCAPASPNLPEPAHLHFEAKYDDRVVDPSGWEGINVSDFWANHVNGATSFPQWLYRHRVQQVVSISTGGQLASSANEIQVNVPASYYSAPLTFSLSSVPVADPTSHLTNSGISFSLIAADSSGTLISQLNNNIEIRINFTANNIADLKLGTLSLYAWNDTTANWSVIATTVDTVNSTAVAYVDHLSVFALMGEPTEKIYLPLVIRSQ